MKKNGYRIAFIAFALLILTISCSKKEKITEPPDVFTPLGMALIPAENVSFMMGSVNGFEDEQPIHEVTFSSDFWMDTTEVTQVAYDSVMNEGYDNYQTPEWHDPYGVSGNYPAYYMTWGDAALYCNARSRLDNLDTVYTYSAIIGTPGSMCELENIETCFSANGYRLPTESEWEFACLGSSETDFYWGQDHDPYPATPSDTTEVSSYAVWIANAWQYGSEDPEFGTHEVASKLPNAYGLYDMAGNLYEWCNDWYGPYPSEASTDPTGPETGDWHCLRGGSWGNYALYLRSANRTFFIPDYIYYFVGFRTVIKKQQE
jgi:formylglycine-generating enzyme required for sulfatase activity